ncbi:recombinase RecT, partial [Fusobacterium necrophorum]|uniref:recombinase RecT n=1 Tax=Fusobacterium necrophorum TaxID=859 RepID=UPI0021C28938
MKHEEKYRKGSFKNDVWNKNFEEMAQKTVVKKLLKWLPVSVEFLENINRDEKTSNWNEQTKEVEVSDELVIDEETGEIVDNSNI